MGIFGLFNTFTNEGYDRIWRNKDGSVFYGYDDEDGTTTWYDPNGNLDSITDTPDEDEQEMNEAGY